MRYVAIMSRTASELLEEASRLFGSETRLAREIGVSQTAVWRARQVNRVSAELAMKIHQATRGRVSKHDLRPDIFGPRRSRKIGDGAEEDAEEETNAG